MSINAYLTANTLSAYTARHETLDGVQYLVAPVVLLVEGVHHGSAGPTFYPLNELSNTPAAWDGRPVTLRHPEIGGEPVSASSSEAIPLFRLGMLLNTIYDSQLGGLRSEVWLDVNKARRMAPDILKAMEKGESIEVSTGLWFDAEGGPGMWGNEEFDTTATSFRPDHLALLPGEVGACSISDGCGLRANKEKGGEMHQENIRATARRPSFSGNESMAWAAPSWAEIVSGYNRARGTSIATSVSISDAPQTLKNWAARLSLLGDENAENFRDLVFFPAVNPANRNLNERALRAVIGGRGSQAQIPAVARESAQALARRLLNSEFDAGLEVQNKGMKGYFDRFIEFMKNEAPPKEEMVKILMEQFTINKPGMLSTVRALQTELDAMDREMPNGMLLHFLEDAFDDGSFIMRRTGPEGSQFFMGSFSVSEDEQVEVANDFSEVREKREFVEVNNENDDFSGVQNGQRLAAFLNREIDRKETDNRSRADIIAAMGSAAGIAAATVNRILAGDIICPPVQRLRGFARALDISISRITSAAEGDGCNYENTENKEERNVSDNTKTLVDNLIACGKTAFNENHRAGLMAMDDSALEALKAKDAPAPAPTPAMAGNEQVQPKTLEEVVAGLPEEHQGPIKEAMAVNEKRKEEAVKNIMAAPGNAFAEADLMAKNLGELESIVALVKGDKEKEGSEEGSLDGNAVQGADFSGKGAVNTGPTGNQGAGKPLGRPIT